MVRPLLTLVIFVILVSQAHAIPALLPVLSPGEQCRTAIAAAEKAHGIPPQLLAAIGRVESGRRDPVTGIGGAWPWTINAEGTGAYFETRAEAIARVESLRGRGVRLIDVGCMQVNLVHHATAFPTLDQAFEPMVNADYAARFLRRLYEQTGDWTKAAAHYHSANPALGEPYAAKVMAVWPEEQRKAGQSSPAAPPPPAMAPALSAFPLARTPPLPVPWPNALAPLPGVTYGRPPGRGLDSYRAMPIHMTSPLPAVIPSIPPRVATAIATSRALVPGLMPRGPTQQASSLPPGSTPPAQGATPRGGIPRAVASREVTPPAPPRVPSIPWTPLTPVASAQTPVSSLTPRGPIPPGSGPSPSIRSSAVSLPSPSTWPAVQPLTRPSTRPLTQPLTQPLTLGRGRAMP